MTLNADDLKEIIIDAVNIGDIEQAVILAKNLNDLQEEQEEEGNKE